MKKPASKKKVDFRKEPESEDDDNGNSTMQTRSSSELNKNKQVSDFPYKKVPALKPVVEVPPLPARYMREKKPQSYKHQTEVEEGVDIGSILERLLKEDVSLSSKELLAIAPKLREAYKDQIAKKRVAVKLAEALLEEDELEATIEKPVESFVQVSSLARPEKVAEKVLDPDGRPYLTWRITDPILEYLESVPRDERSTKVFSLGKPGLVTAKDMESLRVIPTLVNDLREEEALLDSGSQIVSMSRDTAMDCKITWNPDVTINMQSANGQISRTCGLAKNVPFSFGSITVYLQVHVVESAPYKILLGRPFDVLTESRILNSAEGPQMIVITDPNSKHRETLPTYEKGQLPKAKDVNF